MKYLKNIHEHLFNRSLVSKKIKKSVAVVAALLLICSNVNANTLLKAESCEEQAAAYLEAYEYYYGCVSTEKANWIYTVQVGLCNINRQ